jgi:predicted phosphate transport protein (TIGR00153 family)
MVLPPRVGSLVRFRHTVASGAPSCKAFPRAAETAGYYVGPPSIKPSSPSHLGAGETRVPFSLLPRQEVFFDLFVEVARRSHEAAGHLVGLFSEPDRAKYHVEHIKRLEHECDQFTHEVVTRLDRTFITSIDREDIYKLAGDLDDVIDVIDGVASRTQIFHVGAAPEGVKRLAKVIERAVAALVEGVEQLKHGRGDVMKASRNAKALEEEADAIYHEMLEELFETETNAIELIKWKEIYDNLERCVDQTEDVANVLESISIKHA